MKKYLLLPLILISGCVCGPMYPKEFRALVKKNHLSNKAYIEYVKKGSTTRAQDLQMLEANSSAWEALYKIMEATK